jgi:hypothetical protein
MMTIDGALRGFLAEVGEGDRQAVESPGFIIEAFLFFLNRYAPEGLGAEERALLEENQAGRFCDTFPPQMIQPWYFGHFLSCRIVRRLMGRTEFFQNALPVLHELATWLAEKGYWSKQDLALFREDSRFYSSVGQRARGPNDPAD